MNEPAHETQFLILAILANHEVTQEMEALLSGTHFRVDFAASAEEGLVKAEALLPAAIVLEITPLLDSYETCRRLRANRMLNSIPIILLSDHEKRDERAAGLSAGADDFLEKPLDGLELLARLTTITRLNTYRLVLSGLNLFSWMSEHAQEGYLMLDRAGVIHNANERAQELLNLSSDYVGLLFRQAVERLYLPEPEAVWQHWLDEPEPCFLVQPESPTARAVWVVIEAKEMELGPEFRRIVRLRDVTERMSIYQDMRRFHTVVAHKLRTPMSIMFTNLSLLKNRIEMLPPEEIREYARGAIGGAERLSNEIRKILTYIDAPLALNVGQPVSLDQVPALVGEIAQSLNLENVTLSMPETLQTEPMALTSYALEMILHELLENARKFHPNHTPKLEISIWQAESGFINIRVADDGMNLSTEQLRWTWLPYVQGEKDFSGELPGMGIGFPMVATLVWKAGGDLHLRNRADGLGVIVELKIPLESTMRGMERSAKPFGVD